MAEKDQEEWETPNPNPTPQAKTPPDPETTKGGTKGKKTSEKGERPKIIKRPENKRNEDIKTRRDRGPRRRGTRETLEKRRKKKRKGRYAEVPTQ